jgi:hypothetical protein
MSDLHPTVTDKRPPIGLIEDGEWHWYSILDRDGLAKRAVIVPDGTYEVVVANAGRIIEPGPNDIELHVVRYHFDDRGLLTEYAEGDRYHDSTAWATISTNRRNTDRWFDVFPAKVVVKAGSELPTEAHGVGVCYRVDGGRYEREGLILKFLRLLDEVVS